MSSIVFGCVLPHPPIMVPQVGRGELKKIGDTVNAAQEVAGLLAQARPETLVIISPHGPLRPEAMGVSVAPSSEGDLASFSAPDVKVHFDNDLDLVAALEQEAVARHVPLARIGSVRGHYRLDHGVVVPMSYLGPAVPDARLVPLTFSLVPNTTHYSFGQAIQAAARRIGRRVAVIASGDLSHRLIRGAPAGFDPLGKVLDKTIMDAVAAGDPLPLINIDQQLVERGGECGLRSIIILLGALDGLDFTPRVLSYEGPFGVGYMVAVTEIARDGGEAEADSEGEGVSLSFMAGRTESPVPQQPQHPLVELAKRAVEAYVRERRHVDVPDVLSEDMVGKAGVFVCLKKGPHLRGCIGTFEPTRESIAEETIHNAISSATQDPRFPRVSPDELPFLTYTVDVLTAPESVGSMADLDPKRYGVIVESGYRRGLLLPDLEGVDTVEKQVDIARLKAGIRPHEPLKLYRFEVKRYGEPVD